MRTTIKGKNAQKIKAGKKDPGKKQKSVAEDPEVTKTKTGNQKSGNTEKEEKEDTDQDMTQYQEIDSGKNDRQEDIENKRVSEDGNDTIFK